MNIRKKYEKSLETIPVEDIIRPGIIDRIEIDPVEIEALARNIQEQGLLQAPIVRKKEGKYEIVAGDRRILAIKRLGWSEVECVVSDLTDEETAEIRACENLQRVDLTPIEEARIYQNLRDNYGKTIDQIAVAMGRTGGTVKRRLDLLKMPPSLQEAIQRKQISYGVAEALWPISDPSALDYYLGFAIDHGVTVAIARQWCTDWKNSQRRIEEKDEDVETMRSPLENRPTYLACDICEQPELVQNFTLIRLCKRCAREIALVKAKGRGDE